jgi:peptidoglycan hydrolase-like protein with peptidoglycan-binding domain
LVLTFFIAACATFGLLFGVAVQGQTISTKPAGQTKPQTSQKKVAAQPSTAKKGTRTMTARTHRPAPAVRQVRQQTPSVQRYSEIQQALADKGYYKGPVNGQWGPDSVESLKRFQSEHNLESDGKLGSLSLIALGLGPQHTANAQVPGSNKPSTESSTPSQVQSPPPPGLSQ